MNSEPNYNNISSNDESNILHSIASTNKHDNALCKEDGDVINTKRSCYSKEKDDTLYNNVNVTQWKKLLILSDNVYKFIEEKINNCYNKNDSSVYSEYAISRYINALNNFFTSLVNNNSYINNIIFEEIDDALNIPPVSVGNNINIDSKILFNIKRKRNSNNDNSIKRKRNTKRKNINDSSKNISNEIDSAQQKDYLQIDQIESKSQENINIDDLINQPPVLPINTFHKTNIEDTKNNLIVNENETNIENIKDKIETLQQHLNQYRGCEIYSNSYDDSNNIEFSPILCNDMLNLSDIW